MARYYCSDPDEPTHLMKFGDEDGGFYFRRWGAWHRFDWLARKVYNGDAERISEARAMEIQQILDDRDEGTPRPEWALPPTEKS